MKKSGEWILTRWLAFKASERLRLLQTCETWQSCVLMLTFFMNICLCKTKKWVLNVLFSLYSQSRDRSWIGFLKPLQRWTHWRFYFDSLPHSQLDNLMRNLTDFLFTSYFHMFSTCVACILS